MPEHGRDGEPIQAKYPDALKRRLLSFLERRHFRHLNGGRRVISAWPLARALNLRPGQSKESRRRRVRELVKEARLEGAPIASRGGGYFLATEVEDFEQTESFLRRMGLGRLTTAAGIHRSPARQAAAGQLMLTRPLTHRPLAGATDFYRAQPSPPAEPSINDHNRPSVDADGYEIPTPPEGWLFA